MASDFPEDVLKEFIAEFLEESCFMIEDCEESFLKLDQEALRKEELAKIFRVAHTIKGSAGSIGLNELAKFAHSVEDCLAVLRVSPELLRPDITSLLLRANDEFRTYMKLLRAGTHEGWNADKLLKEILEMTHQLESPQVAAPAPVAGAEQGLAVSPEASLAEETAGVPQQAQSATGSQGAQEKSVIKLDANRLDTMLDLIGEMVVLKSQMLQAFEKLAAENLEGGALLALFDKAVRELQERGLQMRMTTIKPVFLKVQRTIRDLSVKLKKPVEIVISGAELEIDRSMIELLADPLMHMVRNSLDHGLESAEARKAAGKPATGTLTLAARQAGGRIVIEISDDGGGISREKVLKRAMERDLIPAGVDPQKMSDTDVYQLLFLPGFSTAEKVTEISGRGVGLDVVKSNVTRLRGTIEVQSQFGKGTTFRISLPLTTAITDGIVVVVEGYRVIIPMAGIREISETEKSQYVQLNARNTVAKIREHLVPLVRLTEELEFPESTGLAGVTRDQGGARRADRDMIVVVDTVLLTYGLVVDSVIGQSQVVVKPLSSAFEKSNGLSGVAILGDGKVGLVLDLEAIASIVQARGSKETDDPEHPEMARACG